jgi:hypothetical protein
MPTELSYRAIADFAEDAICFSLIGPTRVVAWADSLIAEVETPLEWMIDLSMVDQSDPAAIEGALRAVPGQSDWNKSLALLNGLVLREWRRGILTMLRVCAIGWQQYLRHPDLEVTHWAVDTEDAASSLQLGSISETEMRAIINRNLAQFEPAAVLLPAWV